MVTTTLIDYKSQSEKEMNAQFMVKDNHYLQNT